MKNKGYAVISACEKYRYLLGRQVSDNDRVCLFIMLNPSTADAENNDPTVTRCINYAKSWGYGRMVVANIFAYRATNPKELKKVDDPIGPSNGLYLEAILKEVKETNGIVVCAWGVNGNMMGRGQRVLEFLYKSNVTAHCLKMAQSGLPSHPLYLKKSLKPVRLY